MTPETKDEPGTENDAAKEEQHSKERPVTVRPGYRTRIMISFTATADLYGTPAALSVSGLPSGVMASFAPRTATIGGRAVLTLAAAPSSAAGAFTATVTAITVSSDPIGTSTPLGLTVSAP